MSRGIFITGTDTGVGKTLVAVALLQALKDTGSRVGGMKPVAAGAGGPESALFNEDVGLIASVTGQNPRNRSLNPYFLRDPLSPNIAADNAGISIDIDYIVGEFRELQRNYEFVVAEGAGGWHCPITHGRTMADVAVALRLPVLLVVGLRLGCLNHALLTAEAIRRAGLPLFGWIANPIDPQMLAMPENIATLTQRLGAVPLAQLPWSRDRAVIAAAMRPTAARVSALCRDDSLSL